MSWPQPQMYTIFCLTLGTNVPFPVEIQPDATIGKLKDLIKEKNRHTFDRFDAHELTLYHANLLYDADLQKKAVQQITSLDPLIPILEVRDLFPDTPAKKTVHILVKVPEIGLKRKHSQSDDEDQVTKRIRLVQNIPHIAPSSIKMKTLTRDLRGQLAYNRPEASCTTIPIALLHQAFADFLEAYQHHEPTEQDYKWLMELRSDMLQEYPTEAERCSQFRQIFQRHIGVPIPDASIPHTSYRTDGHFTIAEHILLLTEGKNEWVGIGADPQLQALVYYLNNVKAQLSTQGEQIIRWSALPCLIIYYVGPMIGFAGVVTAAKFQFEALTPLFDLATNQHDALALKPVARALGAARAAFNSLQGYYTKLQGPQPSYPVSNPPFPSRDYYSNYSNARVEFDYQRRLDDNKLLFYVLTREGKQKRIIKFTQKYSKDAHDHCASHGIAPQLYAVERIGGGWMMVVMEYLDEAIYTTLQQSNIPKDTLYTVITNAVSVLHQGNFVHGDIRDVNMMVMRSWDLADSLSNIKLLDFDWAGLDGTARYPANVNHEDIRRPQEARDGQLITKAHDNEMAGYLFS